MPIYEYRCTSCEHLFELLETTYDESKEKTCVKCGAAAERIISLTSFQLKGSGWYKTDYVSKPACSSDDKSSPCNSCVAASAKGN